MPQHTAGWCCHQAAVSRTPSPQAEQLTVIGRVFCLCVVLVEVIGGRRGETPEGREGERHTKGKDTEAAGLAGLSPRVSLD